MIMVTLVIIILELIISLIVIHLGMNPMNGGSPPNERKFIEKIIFIFVSLFMQLIICDNVKILFISNIIVMLIVIIV